MMSVIQSFSLVRHDSLTKMFDFEARVLIGWLANTLDTQPIRTRTSKFKDSRSGKHV